MLGSPHVSELYSPPRVTALAEMFNMQTGFALDLTVVDPDDGLPWDFDNEDKRAKVKAKLLKEKTWLRIGSPMCKAFSSLMSLNQQRIGIHKHNALLEHGKIHRTFCIELYTIQLEAGRLLLHEHPQSASSWNVPEVVKLSEAPGVVKVVGHMCQYGMKSQDEQGVGLVKKPTAFMTNS